jgi:hypothetical protein
MSFLAKITVFMALALGATALLAQSHPDFSGEWRQDNEHSQPPRAGNVTLKIVHHDPDLSVETSILRTGRPNQHAIERYKTDGTESTSTGADGDQFASRVVWSGQALAFSIVEHEDGRTLVSSETWSLIDQGRTLERRRTRANAATQQVILYRRQP